METGNTRPLELLGVVSQRPPQVLVDREFLRRSNMIVDGVRGSAEAEPEPVRSWRRIGSQKLGLSGGARRKTKRLDRFRRDASQVSQWDRQRAGATHQLCSHFATTPCEVDIYAGRIGDAIGDTSQVSFQPGVLDCNRNLFGDVDR